MSNYPSVPALESKEEKRLRLLSLACVALLGLVYLTAQLLRLRMNCIFQELTTSVNTIPCGRVMYDSLRVLLGFAGFFYISSHNKEERSEHLLIWGLAQILGVWVLAYPTASFYRPLGDGLGIALIIFAPVVTLPSYLAAYVMACYVTPQRSLRGTLICRWFCIAILLGIIIICTSLFAYAEYEARIEKKEQRGTQWSASSP